jgi:hypothetical protein
LKRGLSDPFIAKGRTFTCSPMAQQVTQGGYVLLHPLLEFIGFDGMKLKTNGSQRVALDHAILTLLFSMYYVLWTF